MPPYRILLVINKPERELKIMEKIRRFLLDPALHGHVEVEILECRDPNFLGRVLRYRPHMIFTFPFTAITTSYPFYLFKFLFKCHVICFRTEGAINFYSQQQVDWLAGMEKYGSTLVDYELFWGEKTAQVVGERLLRQSKLRFPSQLKVFGYPLYEEYFDRKSDPRASLPEDFLSKVDRFPKEKVLFFVTGFHLADYTAEDIRNAGDCFDPDAGEEAQEMEVALDGITRAQRYRQLWIDTIITVARNRTDLLLIVKSHPIEGIIHRRTNNDPYKGFVEFDNILYINSGLTIPQIMPFCGLFFHYGSTTVAESFLRGVPSVFVSSNELYSGGKDYSNSNYYYSDLGWPSTLCADITEVPEVVCRHLTSTTQFSMTASMKNVLRDVFNITDAHLTGGGQYLPSRDIAKFLLSLCAEAPLGIAETDPHLLGNPVGWYGVQAIDLLCEAGMKLVDSGEYHDALAQYFDKALSMALLVETKVPNLSYLRALCFFKMGDVANAREALENELGCFSDNEQARLLLEQITDAAASRLPFSTVDPIRSSVDQVKSDAPFNCDVAFKNEEYPNLDALDNMLPEIFSIETALACNLRCPECAIGGGAVNRSKGFLSFKRFKVIADKVRPYAKYIYLHIWGEPMLNPEIIPIIGCASQFSRTNISTNALTLTPELAESLMTSGVSDVIVSIDGVSQEVYEKYRVGGDVEKALAALRMLQELNIKHGCHVQIIPQFIAFKHNQHEMKEFESICTSIGLNAMFKAPYIRNHDTCFCYSDYPQLQRPHFSNVMQMRQAMRGCQNARNVFTILLDGSTVACCHDYDRKSNFGNIFNQDLLEIWNSSAYTQFRQDVFSGKAPEFCVENCMSYFLQHTDGEEKIEKKPSGAFKKGTFMKTNDCGKRAPHRIVLNSLAEGLQSARDLFSTGQYLNSFDVYEQLVEAYPDYAVALLAEVYDRYKEYHFRDRYHLYQARHFNFGIRPGDKILDIGSGHIPFPLATHLADISITNDRFGRAGVPFKYIDGKPVYECSVEDMPFGDGEFDFVYCSHVLEHAQDPEKACKELMRVARRGYIETPSRGKDIFLNSIGVSNHLWGIDVIENRLIFREYSAREKQGFQSDILQQMHSIPQTEREKAFSALIYLKADLVNSMLLWDGGFDYEVMHRGVSSCDGDFVSTVDAKFPSTSSDIPGAVQHVSPGQTIRFLQIHTFYSSYLDGFYRQNPENLSLSFSEQINALVRDGFSGSHMIAPYLNQCGYDAHLVIANNPHSQSAWAREHGVSIIDGNNWVFELAARQIEYIKPDVLYLSDPITFDSRFVRSLSWKPKLILGWRAAVIPEGTDWSEFDVILSGLTPLREFALKLGAKNAERFFPGYPVWVNNVVGEVTPKYDVVFSGQWSSGLHGRRNEYLRWIASSSQRFSYSVGYYLSEISEKLPPDMASFNLGGRFGLEMHRALMNGKILFDSRATHMSKDPVSGQFVDLCGSETSNMRIIEATGCGRMLLTEHFDNLSEYFQVGREIETFSNQQDLVEKISYYLAHPLEREAIARRGQERCLRDYSMEKRAEEFDSIVRKFLSGDGTIFRPSSSIVDLKGQAKQAFAENRIHDAFQILIKAKALKEPLENLDLIRAHCFIKMNMPDAAIQALLEELRFFPGNQDARQLLNSLQSRPGYHSVGIIDDSEFQMILAKIRPYTMLGEARLYNLYRLARYVCEKDIPGNFVECGVAAGGSSALLAYVIKTYSKGQRYLFAFDSFEGMPEPTALDTVRGIDAESTGWGTGTCAAPEVSVRNAAMELGVLPFVKPVKGYFEQTLPAMKGYVGQIGFMHMDADWYESIKTILENFYDSLAADALLQLDDYGYWEGCGKALHEFEAKRAVRFQINQIDGNAVWFQKP